MTWNRLWSRPHLIVEQALALAESRQNRLHACEFALFLARWKIAMMKLSLCRQIVTIGLVLFSVASLPTSVSAQSPLAETALLPVAAAATVDVALSAEGTLRGVCVDAEGEPVASAPIYVLQEDKVVALVLSNEQGRFSVDQIDGGMYQIVHAGGATTCRAWTALAAPPSAHGELLLVSGATLRAQISPAVQFLGNPWVITGVVVTAITVPVAIHNIRRDRASASSP